MKRSKHSMVLAAFIALIFLGLSVEAAASGEVPRMTKEELKPLLGNPDVVVIDVRKDRGWMTAETKIEGAVREEAGGARTWGQKYDKNKTYILCCA